VTRTHGSVGRRGEIPSDPIVKCFRVQLFVMHLNGHLTQDTINTTNDYLIVFVQQYSFIFI